MNPFESHRASVFVVTSPFQALCALAAINQLEINDYKIFAVLPHKESRNQQLIRFLTEQHLDFVPVNTKNSFLRIKLLQLKALFMKNKSYTRLFVGDIRNMTELNIGCCNVSDGSDIIYLDDGNFSVSVLKGIVSFKNGKYYDLLMRVRNIELHKNLLTIYNDIPSPSYNIEPLFLDNAFKGGKSLSGEKKHGVYVVGTNIGLYCKSVGISEERYIQKLDLFLQYLKNKYPEERIVFIPHGRDKSLYASSLCEKYGLSFMPSSTMVELELSKQPATPLAIYGYTSSALFNLKKLYPSTDVFNILYEAIPAGLAHQEYESWSSYYSGNGIKTIKETIV